MVTTSDRLGGGEVSGLRQGARAHGRCAAPAGDPDELVDDPTSNGQITRRTLHLYQQTIVAFPDTSWACYSPRPGSVSEHPLGRACDGAFGNAIGQRPTPAQRELGWDVELVARIGGYGRRLSPGDGSEALAATQAQT